MRHQVINYKFLLCLEWKKCKICAFATFFLFSLSQNKVFTWMLLQQLIIFLSFRKSEFHFHKTNLNVRAQHVLCLWRKRHCRTPRVYSHLGKGRYWRVLPFHSMEDLLLVFTSARTPDLFFRRFALWRLFFCNWTAYSLFFFSSMSLKSMRYKKAKQDSIGINI